MVFYNEKLLLNKKLYDRLKDRYYEFYIKREILLVKFMIRL